MLRNLFVDEDGRCWRVGELLKCGSDLPDGFWCLGQTIRLLGEVADESVLELGPDSVHVEAGSNGELQPNPSLDGVEESGRDPVSTGRYGTIVTTAETGWFSEPVAQQIMRRNSHLGRSDDGETHLEQPFDFDDGEIAQRTSSGTGDDDSLGTVVDSILD